MDTQGGVKLQLALDMVDLDDAVRLVDEVKPFIDIIEVGTPLLHRHGPEAISVLRREFAEVPVIADCKVMDRGAEEVRWATEAGADGVVIQAAAPRATIEAAGEEAERRGASIMLDGLGRPEPRLVADVAARFPVSHYIAHIGKDEQRLVGGSPATVAHAVAGWPGLPPLAVAGGLTPDAAAEVVCVDRVEIVICGEAITGSDSPGIVAAALRSVCDSRVGEDRVA